MSNRINQLIEECTSVYDDVIYDGRDTRWKTTEYFDKQKFAELIVRECLYIARLQRNNMQFLASNPPQSAAAYDIERNIMNHFGVEE